jgi:hypothetical protein
MRNLVLTPFKAQLDESLTNFRIEQDVTAYREAAHADRLADQQASATRSWRKFAIIPDIVAIDIKTRYGIDIHAPETLQDKPTLDRFKSILRSEFPDLLTQDKLTRAH